MTPQIFLDPPAVQDIQEAYDYYQVISEELGEQFLDVLNDNFESLRKTPYFQKRFDNIHGLPLQKFPFIIHYSYDSALNQIVIRALFHTSKLPRQS